jgi:hypothetical protein
MQRITVHSKHALADIQFIQYKYIEERNQIHNVMGRSNVPDAARPGGGEGGTGYKTRADPNQLAQS